MLIQTILPSPIGNLLIEIENEKLTHMGFTSNSSTQIEKNSFIKKIQQELDAYFKNPHHSFNIEMEMHGTDFQKKVWCALTKIPSGKTESYKSIAQQLKTSPRAVGNACRTNPLLLIVPCHRVVASNHIGGFTGNIKGHWVDIKKWLLRHEGIPLE